LNTGSNKVWQASYKSNYSKQYDLGVPAKINSVKIEGILAGSDSRFTVKYRTTDGTGVYGDWSTSQDITGPAGGVTGTVNVHETGKRYIEVAIIIDDNGRMGTMAGDGASELSKITIDNNAVKVGPGNMIVFSAPSVEGTYNLYTMDTDGRGVAQLTNNTGDQCATNPHFSPDGTKIAFTNGINYQTGDVTGCFGGVRIINWDGTFVKDINATADSAIFGWSPDGNQLLMFDRSLKKYYTVKYDGTGLFTLYTCASQCTQSAGWHPTNGKIYIWENGTIYSINPNGSSKTYFIQPAGTAFPAFGGFTADGQKLFFTMIDSTNNTGKIYSINIDKTGKAQIGTEDHVWSVKPSRNEQILVAESFTGAMQAPSNIVKFEIGGTDKVQLTNYISGIGTYGFDVFYGDCTNGCSLNQCDETAGCDDYGVCVKTFKDATTTCSLADKCKINPMCDGSGQCVASGTTECTKEQCDLTAECDNGGVCQKTPDVDKPCSDGDLCTTGEKCNASYLCTGGVSHPCPAETCKPDNHCDGAGGCAFTPTTGTKCDDGHLCTKNKACKADGSCGSEAYTCTPADGVCEMSNVCDGDNGCKLTIWPEGTECNYGDNCDKDKYDSNGKCTVQQNYPCNVEQCDLTAACDGLEGCKKTYKNIGEGCSDSDPCTKNHICDGNGKCLGGESYTCVASQCQLTSICDGLGGCTVTNKPDTELCSDGSNCTYAEHCDGEGQCIGGINYTCTPGQCDESSTCNGSGGCVKVSKAKDTPCSDGSNCTKDHVCDGSGVCGGGTTYDCPGPTQCQVSNQCDGLGGCTPVNKLVTDSCNTGDPCSINDHCDGAGKCVSGGWNPVCPDGGVPDAGDAGTDASIPSDASTDVHDAGPEDAGEDTGLDGGNGDIGITDAGHDAATPDSGHHKEDKIPFGCSCSTVSL
jgi:hypothetical protein